MADDLALKGQIQTWLAEKDEEIEVQAFLDLDGIGWVIVNSLRDLGEMIEVSYRGTGFDSLLGDTELVCESSVLKAIRRRKEISSELWEDRGEDIPFPAG